MSNIIDVRTVVGPDQLNTMTSDAVRRAFMLENLFVRGEIRIGYTYWDRLLTGGGVPVDQALVLEAEDLLHTEYFLERREVGIVNIGEPGKIAVDHQIFNMGTMDFLYIGKGCRRVELLSNDSRHPARYYFVSTPAHAEFPTSHMVSQDTECTELGDAHHANQRILHKWIYPHGIQSSQLVMGFTELKQGSVWNTLPPHRHARRTEVYMYFDLGPNERVMHFMGEPSAMRHAVLANESVVVSPPWSIHMGVGTSRYSFVWSTGGENTSYTDQDAVAVESLC